MGELRGDKIRLGAGYESEGAR